VVATVLEAASGERYDRLIERLVFKPLGVKACLNWTLCDADMQARAVTLYRHTGEVAADAPERLPPACTIPVAEGQPCDLDAYVPGTNASIFSPQGGVRIGMMDLARIGQALIDLERGGRDFFLLPATGLRAMYELADGRTQETVFFCSYGLHLQIIEVPERPCSDDRLVGDGRPRIGHSGEAYGLQSGLWIDPKNDEGFVYFTTEVPPAVGGEDTGGFTNREKALIKRALGIAGK
jgi:CubicO group peptidase (beta-lactamase class C family)